MTPDDLAAELIGTCKSLDDVIDKDDYPTEFFLKLDDLVLECVQCNWWQEASEMVIVDDEYVCNQCNEEEG